MKRRESKRHAHPNIQNLDTEQGVALIIQSTISAEEEKPEGNRIGGIELYDKLMDTE
jgi:hypothetical protein|tara:strand:+ start:3862 stop:4032 length:171 start_codon:yes stop_codon:yes gene_type:complete